MQLRKQVLISSAITGLLSLAALTVANAAGGESAGGPVVSGTWEHRKASFNYFGITSLYSCSGLETDVAALLKHLGARKDLTVRAYGCPYGYNAPGRTAIVDVDFYSLSPSAEAAAAADTVRARWTPVEVSANHPYFIGQGDCELIDEMKDILSRNFSLRDLNYRTDCVPHEVNINDFSVKAEVLKPLPTPVASAATG
jgi:hypothetical protein